MSNSSFDDTNIELPEDNEAEGVQPIAPTPVTQTAQLDLEQLASEFNIDVSELIVEGAEAVDAASDFVVIDGVEVPLSILDGNVDEIEPAAGPAQPGFTLSGGGSAEPFELGSIGPVIDITDLLPPTELLFTRPEEELLSGDLDPDNGVPDVIAIPDVPVDPATVTEPDLAPVDTSANENALPGGSNVGSGADVAAGDLDIDTNGDVLDTVIVDGVDVTNGGTVDGDYGTLTITLNDDGTYSWTYVLGGNTIDHNDPTSTGTDEGVRDEFEIVVSDTDGDTGSDSLVVNILDDGPVAVDDSGDQVGENTPITIDAFPNDTPGADGVDIDTGVTLVEGSLSGTGSVVDNGDGTFTYTPGPGEEGSVTFNYTITDADGDVDTALVTINLNDDSEPTIEVLADTPSASAGDASVDEAALPEGSNPTSDTETTEGDFAIDTGGDTVGSLVVGGVDVTNGGTVAGNFGDLVVTVDVDGNYAWSYTLTDNTDGDTVVDTFRVEVTDSDGDTASDLLIIDIIDDVPTAVDDSGAQDEVNDPVVVDVFANDTPGADGVDLVDGVVFIEGTLNGTGSVAYNDDGTFTYTPGAGEEGTVTFNYRITDGDGDSSAATVTITLLEDDEPTIDVNPDTPSAGPGDTSVDEAALDDGGSMPALETETTTGSLAVDTGDDGLNTLIIEGVDVTDGGTVNGDFGVLTITANPDGSFDYSYTLSDNTDGDDTQDVFTLVVTDGDGDQAQDTLTIDIIDDVPTAVADTDALAAGEYGPVSGNVITDSEANGDNGADTLGADGASITGVSAGDTNAVISNGDGVGVDVQGQYGVLTLNDDGSYSYIRDHGTEGGVDDIFTYTLTDGDGDSDTTTLTITIGDAAPMVEIPEAGEPGAVVDEAGLPERGIEPEGTDAASDSETTDGVISFNAGDGPASVTINGALVTDTSQTIEGDFGTLTITAINDGSIAYTYTLNDNTSGDDTSDDFDVVVTDQDGDPATGTLSIAIIDDEPIAVPDLDVVLSGETETGNVITDASAGDTGDLDDGADNVGADDAVLTGVAVGDTGADVSGSVGEAIVTALGTLTLNEDGSYTYTANPNVSGEDVFTYTLTDGDGDTATTTLTITVSDGSPVATAVVVSVNEASLDTVQDGDDLAAGTVTGTLGTADNGETVTDAVTFTDPNGDVVTVTGVSAGDSGGADVSGNVGTIIMGENGVLQLNADGTYTYTLTNNSLDHTTVDSTASDGVADVFTYTVTDSDGNTDTQTLTVEIFDDVPSITGAAVTLDEDGVVADQDIGGVTNQTFDGNQDLDVSNAATDIPGTDTSASGSLGINIGADGLASIVFADGAASFDAIWDNDGVPTQEAVVLTWEQDGIGGTLTATGADSGNIVFELTADDAGDFTLNLNAPLVHSDPDIEDDLLLNLSYTATDGDGDTATADFELTIDDDRIGANDDCDFVEEGVINQDVNAALVLDVSGSINASEYRTYLDAVREAGEQIFNSTSGDASITLIVFGSDADSLGTFTTLGAFEQAINSIDPNVFGGSRPTFDLPLTSFEDALIETMDSFEAVPDAINQIFFLSDGNPTIDGDLSNDNLPTQATLDAFEAFLNQTGMEIDFTGVAIGDQIDIANLNFIDLDGNMNAVAAPTFDDILDVLLNLTMASGSTFADGNVITGEGTEDGGADYIGADGLFSLQWEDSSEADGIDTDMVIVGEYGTLIVAEDGSYIYIVDDTNPALNGAGSTDILTDSFNYILTDGDGDVSSATLDIKIVGDDDGIIITGLDVVGGEAQLDEDDLSDGSSPDAAALTQDGVFSFTTPDGANDVSFNGVDFVVNGVVVNGTEVFLTSLGELTITDFTADVDTDGDIVGGTFTYEYTLSDNTLDHGPNDNGQNNIGEEFLLHVTDTDGSANAGTLDIVITDDVPTAIADNNTVDEGLVLTVDAADGVLPNDISGADGPAEILGVRAADGDNTTDVSGGLGVSISGDLGTLVLNSDGSYTYEANGDSISSDSQDVFVYTISDADGDLSTTTLTINVNDVTLQADNQTQVVDESALDLTLDGDDLSAGTAEGSNPSDTGETVTGTLVVAGDNITFTPTTQTTANGIFELLADGSYTYTLTTPVDSMPTANDGANTETAVDTFTYVATDENGNSTMGTVTINVVDDTPTAVDDFSAANPLQISNNGSVSIDALANDIFGADGVDADNNPDLAVATITQGSQGTVSYNPGTSQFTYTPDDGASGPDSFTYQITDGDGDVSTATVYVNINDTAPVLEAIPDAEVDEDGFAFANVDEPNALETDSTESTTQSLSFEVDFREDFDAGDPDFAYDAFAFTADNIADLAGQLTSGGDAVTWRLEDSGHSLIGSANGVDVISVTYGGDFAPTGGGDLRYGVDVEILQPVDHPVNSEEDTITLSGVTISVTDSDGSVSTDSFDIDVVDDVPAASDDGSFEAVAGTALVIQTALDNDEFGADGVALTDVSVTTQATLGTVTYDSDTGHFTYIVVDDTASGMDSFTYTIVDGDGDASTATVNINVTAGDTDPVVVATASAIVDEDGFGDANEDGADNALELDGNESVVNVQTITVDFGADVPANLLDGIDLSTAGLNGQLDGFGTAADDDITWNVSSDGLTLTGTSGAIDVLTIQITDATPGGTSGQVIYEYTVTLLQPIDHDGNNSETSNTLNNVEFIITDSDGSTVDGTFNITVFDDIPTATDDTDSVQVGVSEQDVNAALVIDLSGSINSTEYGQLLDAIRAAGEEIFASTPNASITLLGFAETSVDLGTFTTLLSFQNAINDIDSSLAGGSRPNLGFLTNYEAALNEIMDSYSPVDGENNQIFFLSDGDPTTGGQSGTNLPLQTTLDAFESFLTIDNEVTFTGIGIGDNITIGNLNAIDLDGNPNAILVDDFDGLLDTLGDAINFFGSTSGNVLTGADTTSAVADEVGADGLAQLVWEDASEAGAVDTDGVIVGSYGTLTVDSDGNYTYTIDENNAAVQALGDGDTLTETFGYSIQDNDGDSNGAELTITINGPTGTSGGAPKSDFFENDFSMLVAREADPHESFGAERSGMTEIAAALGLATLMGAENDVASGNDFALPQSSYDAHQSSQSLDISTEANLIEAWSGDPLSGAELFPTSGSFSESASLETHSLRDFDENGQALPDLGADMSPIAAQYTETINEGGFELQSISLGEDVSLGGLFVDNGIDVMLDQAFADTTSDGLEAETTAALEGAAEGSTDQNAIEAAEAGVFDVDVSVQATAFNVDIQLHDDAQLLSLTHIALS